MKRATWIISVLVFMTMLSPVVCHADAGSDLCKAVRDNDIQKVRELIAAGADVNAYAGSTEFWTPLINAAYTGNIEIVRLLIDKGAGVNTVAADYTPLLEAVIPGNFDVVRLLIDKGADVNFKDSKGETPLILAAFNGRTEIVKLLIEKGADVNARANNGETALSNAEAGDPFFPEEGGYTDIVNLLRGAGAQ